MKVFRIIKEYFPDAIVILFGSRARGDYLEDSDYDIIVVSSKFKGIHFTKRSEIILRILWNAGIRDDIEVLCYTPEEFKKKKSMLGIVQNAVEEGIILQ